MNTERRNSRAALIVIALVTAIGVSLPVGAQVIVGVVDLGENGGAVAANPNTHLVYVAVTGKLKVYDAQTHALVTTISLPQNYSACYAIEVNTVTNRIYAVGFRTYVIDGNTHAVLQNLDKRGRDIAVNTATNRVYIGNIVLSPYADPYLIHVLDGADNTWLPDINLGNVASFEYIYLDTDPATNRVYVAFTGDDDLRVLDGNSHAEVARVHLADIGNVAVNPTTNRIYVRTSYEGAVVLDGTTHAQIGTIPKISGRLRLNPLTNHIYGWASRSPGYILQIADGATNAVADNVYLDGNLENYGLSTTLGKVFALHASWPSAWAKKMTVIQDVSSTGPVPSPVPDLLTTLDLPEDADAVAVNSVTNRVYVGVDGGLRVFDALTLASLPFINLATDSYAPPIYDVGVDEAQNRIYAVSVSRTYVINGANNQKLGELAGGNKIAVNPNNGRVYITDDAVWLGDPDRLRIYDGRTLAHIRTIDLGTSSYYQHSRVAVNPTTGYAYCTYSLDDNLRIISPTTDDVVQTIDYSSSGDIAVNPTTNRVYVWVSRSGQYGALVLDGNTHEEVEPGMIQGISGKLVVNPLLDRLYSTSSRTLFQVHDATSGQLLGRLFLDDTTGDYALHPILSRLYAIMASRKLAVIQDSGGQPTPTATPTITVTPSRTATPTRTRTPFPTPSGGWPYHLYLPLLLRS